MENSKTKIILSNFLKSVFPGILSGILHALSFPNVLWGNGCGLVALGALIPVLFAVFRAGNKKAAFLAGFTYGATAYAFTVSFYYGNCFTSLYFVSIGWHGLMYALMFMLFPSISKRLPKSGPFIMACFFLTYQFLMISGFWLATYLGFLPYALYWYPVLTQILDIVGVHGLMFIVVLPQITVAGLLAKKDNRKNLRLAVIISIVLIIFQIVYGIIMLDVWKNKGSDSTIRLGLVQPNCGDYDDDYGTEKGYERLSSQIRNLQDEDVDVIITSETAFTYPLVWFSEYPAENYRISDIGPQMYYDILKQENIVKDLLAISADSEIPIIVGNQDLVLSDGATPYPDGIVSGNHQVNRVTLIENGQVSDYYDKLHLAPVVETFPFANTDFISDIYDKLKIEYFRAGESANPLTVDGIKIATPVCFEGHFPYICSAFGADIFVSMGSNSYDRIGWGQLHDAMISSFRAIENRRTYARIFNTGLSCLFTPWGEMTESIPTNEMIEVIWNADIYNSTRTLYSYIPNLFGWIAVTVCVLSLFILSVKRKRVDQK